MSQYQMKGLQGSTPCSECGNREHCKSCGLACPLYFSFMLGRDKRKPHEVKPSRVIPTADIYDELFPNEKNLKMRRAV